MTVYEDVSESGGSLEIFHIESFAKIQKNICLRMAFSEFLITFANRYSQ
ncbi:hypothetical protein HMPREF9141_1727 [Prevotella multiformis DSM 16608]|uniref:Uncharacterized protein n=1 Tax=Prevotella multiformis DSM 16608 TaxID=888743 RepID=F0F810_9BACT|nr:hypothetical protein HMPREF9141_1727 [Prevotella multiformis DSM 16608]